MNAAMLSLDHVATDGQANSEAFRLGREESVEHAVGVFQQNSRAVVGHLHDRILSRGVQPGGDRDGWIRDVRIRTGFHRVHQKINQDMRRLNFIDVNSLAMPRVQQFLGISDLHKGSKSIHLNFDHCHCVSDHFGERNGSDWNTPIRHEIPQTLDNVASMVGAGFYGFNTLENGLRRLILFDSRHDREHMIGNCLKRLGKLMSKLRGNVTKDT